MSPRSNCLLGPQNSLTSLISLIRLRVLRLHGGIETRSVRKNMLNNNNASIKAMLQFQANTSHVAASFDAAAYAVVSRSVPRTLPRFHLLQKGAENIHLTGTKNRQRTPSCRSVIPLIGREDVACIRASNIHEKSSNSTTRYAGFNASIITEASPRLKLGQLLACAGNISCAGPQHCSEQMLLPCCSSRQRSGQHQRVGLA